MKIEQSLKIIEASLSKSKNPIVMCSFGKDSLVLLHLVRQLKLMPVLYFKEPFFPVKDRFKNELTELWNLTVYDFPPSFVRTIQDDNNFEVINMYRIHDNKYLFLPTGIESHVGCKEFLCGRYDLLEKPTASLNDFPWDIVFIGHKSSDVNPFLGNTPVLQDEVSVGKVTFSYPLRDWTDDDIWDYIESNNIPYNHKRYGNRAELQDKSFNNDYFPTCYKCLDYKEESTVLCPKTGQFVENIAMTKEMNEADLNFYKGILKNIETH